MVPTTSLWNAVNILATCIFQVPTKDLRKQMGLIPENVYMPFSYFAVKRAQWLMREDLLFTAFFLLSSLSMVLHSKPVWPKVTEQKKRDSICGRQQALSL